MRHFLQTDLGCELVAVEELAAQSAMEVSSSTDDLVRYIFNYEPFLLQKAQCIKEESKIDISSTVSQFSFSSAAPLGSSFPLDRRMLVYRYVRYVYNGDGFSRLSHVTEQSVGELRASMQIGFSAQARYLHPPRNCSMRNVSLSYSF